MISGSSRKVKRLEIGGLNKGRPNIEDIKNANLFAEKLLKLV